MNGSCLKLTFCMLLTIVVMGCEAKEMEVTTADRCVLVDAIQERGRELVPVLDDFAESWGLEMEKSSPPHPRYLLRVDESVVGEISFRVGMGRFGAVLSLFRFNERASQKLVDQFDEVVARFEQLGFMVTPCDDVEGFQRPRTYR